MYTIIGGDGKEYGPVTTEQIQGWIAAGRANLETRAKAAGTEEWRRLGDFPDFGGSGAEPPVIATAASPPGQILGGGARASPPSSSITSSPSSA